MTLNDGGKEFAGVVTSKKGIVLEQANAESSEQKRARDAPCGPGSTRKAPCRTTARVQTQGGVAAASLPWPGLDSLATPLSEPLSEA